MSEEWKLALMFGLTVAAIVIYVEGYVLLLEAWERRRKRVWVQNLEKGNG